MWESPGNSHAVAIQWVHMVVDPLATILSNCTYVVVASKYTSLSFIMIGINYMALRAMCKYSTLLTPSVYILSFNSIEALEKNYLAQLPSHSLSDPTFCREREGMLNRIAVDCITMKNRVLGPASSIELSPPGETSVGFPWRPVPEHLVSLPGIGEPLTAGDPPLSQTRQLPHPLGQTSLRNAQWFDLCPMTDLFFKEMVEVMKEIAPMWHMWDMHAIMQ